MRLLLIRHGESQHSVRRLVAGTQGCPGLTERGREQAEHLRRRLAEERDRIDVVMSSPVPRARETAAIVFPPRTAGEAVGVDCALCEMHVGAGDGLGVEEFAARYGAFDLQAEPDRPISPTGDSWNAFQLRVRDTLRELARRNPGRTVAAVSHAGFIVQSFLELFAVPRPGTGSRVDPDFTSITEWEYTPSGDFWRLVRFNDTAHLPRS